MHSLQLQVKCLVSVRLLAKFISYLFNFQTIKKSPFRLVVRTLPFRGKGTGSIPVRDKNGKRNVAQPGSASALGAEGRVFESRRSDSGCMLMVNDLASNQKTRVRFPPPV